jgi:outer membrane receptor protein involved in Fe transport
LEQRGYAQIDAHFDVTPLTGHWKWSFFGRNLTNQQYLTYGSVAPGTTGGLLAFTARGIQLGMQGGFSF